MSERPLVSVIIPTYQRERLLEETLRTVFDQTWRELEVVVADDGSTDGTAAMLARLGDPRIVHRWAENTGHPGRVRNRGVKAARGGILFFCDSDDPLEPVAVEHQVSALLADDSLQAVACNGFWLPARDGALVNRLPADTRISLAELLRRNVCPTTGLAARREPFEALGGFDESEAARRIEDYDMWLRLLLHRDLSILVRTEPLFHYRQHEGNRHEGIADEFASIRCLFERLAPRRPEAFAAALDERWARHGPAVLRERFRRGEIGMREWLSRAEVPLARRVRLAVKALAVGRGRI